MFTGPNINKDGLVLMLDAASVKSFKGEPTTNIAAENLGFSNMTQGGISYSFVGIEDGWRKYSISGTGNSNTYPYTFNILLSTILVSTRTSFSFKYKTNVESKYVSFGDPRMVNISYAAGRSSTHTQENNYRTAKLENVSPASGTEVQSQRIYFLSRPIEGAVFNPSTDFLYFKDVQAERSPYATRFTNGTRGTTVATGGGWKDISGNNNHGEILNGTTTSNDGTILGALDFDGTNDYVQIGSIAGDFSNFTVIVWFYPTSVSNYENPIDCNYSYNGNTGNIGPRLEMNSSGRLSWVYSNVTNSNNSYYNHRVVNSGLSANTWHCSAITFDGSNSTTYLNGTTSGLSRSTAGTATGFVGSFTNVNLGRGFHLGGAERIYTGRIAQSQIYNRALTATEIQQNYKATKSRFGI